MKRVTPIAPGRTGAGDARGADSQAAPKTPARRRKRYAFAGDVFFGVPTRLYDGGFAARMKPAEIARYVTLLRVSNYDYGAEAILLSAPELALLDGIAPRSARRIYTTLLELGLVEKGPGTGRGATLILVHPWRWPDLRSKPRLTREDGKLTCSPE